MFLTVTGLSLPTLVTVIAPVALFIATIYTLNKLNGDSELIVMRAAGMPPQRILRPFLALGAGVCAARRLHDHLRHAGELPGTARPDHQDPRRLRRQHRQGRPVHRARQRRHLPLPRALRRRAARHLHAGPARAEEDRSSTSPSAARPSRPNGQSYLVLEKGSVHRKQPNSRDSSIVAFERYAVDLAAFNQDGRQTSSTSRASARRRSCCSRTRRSLLQDARTAASAPSCTTGSRPGSIRSP